MFDLIAVTALYQCYNIEANRTIQIEITDVRIRSSYDPPYLLIETRKSSERVFTSTTIISLSFRATISNS